MICLEGFKDHNNNIFDDILNTEVEYVQVGFPKYIFVRFPTSMRGVSLSTGIPQFFCLNSML